MQPAITAAIHKRSFAFFFWMASTTLFIAGKRFCGRGGIAEEMHAIRIEQPIQECRKEASVAVVVAAVFVLRSSFESIPDPALYRHVYIPRQKESQTLQNGSVALPLQNGSVALPIVHGRIQTRAQSRGTRNNGTIRLYTQRYAFWLTRHGGY